MLTEAERTAAETRISEISSVLKPQEVYWKDHYDWLEGNGYHLRPRYRPDWVPSWKTKNISPTNCEDRLTPVFDQVIDATRIKDGVQVALKKVKKSLHPHELEIASFFSSEPLASDPHNHCLPVLDILQAPDDVDVSIMVMPLCIAFNKPEFDTVGEVVDFFEQIFRGLHFMHHHHVAHRDCNRNNIMMDGVPLFPEGCHPLRYSMKLDYTSRSKILTRTQRPPKYYLVDFGISRQYGATSVAPLDDIILGGDKSVPEFQNTLNPQNPFPADVYYVGNMIKMEFLDGSSDLFLAGRYGFDFMRPLVNDMTQEDPTKRPTMDEVVSRFETISRGLGFIKLRSRVVNRDDTFMDKIVDSVGHWKRRWKYVFSGVPAVPNYASKSLK